VTPVAGPYTVDASVFLSAFNPREPGHAQSLRLLAGLQRRMVPIVVPTLLLPEVAGAIGRGQRDSRLVRQFVATLARLPHLVLVPLDAGLARRASDIAADHRLRGSDAVYAAVALQFVSTLVTLDQEQQRRVSRVLAARRPGDADLGD
jgi:predicted nucleic acid-binding protein